MSDWLNINFEDAEANPLSNFANLYLYDDILENVVIPNDVVNINNFAFYGCTSIKIVFCHDYVTEIGSAFAMCSNLQQITLPSTLNNNSSIDLKSTALLEVSIPEGVSYFTLTNCANLKKLTIPSSVTGIYYMALDGCSSLDTINYNGSIEQWTQIYKNSDWNNDIIATSVACMNGTVAI